MCIVLLQRPGGKAWLQSKYLIMQHIPQLLILCLTGGVTGGLQSNLLWWQGWVVWTARVSLDLRLEDRRIIFNANNYITQNREQRARQSIAQHSCTTLTCGSTYLRPAGSVSQLPVHWHWPCNHCSHCNNLDAEVGASHDWFSTGSILTLQSQTLSYV